ncbi:MAG TPA: helicase HerA-like domain-containing protein [Gaiellaceae bacterium]|nr:helicase HerA-like domain-containing protein [Gaiellaceae bacterium]
MARTALDPATFGAAVAEAYATKGGAVELGTAMLEGALVPDGRVRLPLATMNRHGLIAGATGTGKTRTLQVIAEQLSAAGVAVFAADVKGDVSGMAVPGSTDGPAKKRANELGLQFTPTGFPVEYLSLGGIGPGVPVRATVTDFGPLLLAKVLGANATQEQSLALVFHYADTKGLPLLDLSDLRALLTFLDSDAGRPELKGIGGLSPQTVGVLLRSLVSLETGGGNEFFGEPQLDLADLLRTAPDGRGVISSLELPAVQDKPRLWSTVLMWLVAELFEQLPEVGDRDKPRLVFFLDEAHLLFEGASKAFVESTVQTVRLIRSKGVGVFFVTQTPKDVPADVLAQLGNRIQHALRAFTPDDAKALRATVRTFPKSDAYDLEELLTQLGTGEAAVTILSESGVPTPVVHTRMRPPVSRMGPADDVAGAAQASELQAKYGTRLDSESARELLAKRLDPPAPGDPPPAKPTERQKGAGDAVGNGADAIGDFLKSSSGRALTREVVRGMFGMLKRGI